MRKLSGPLRRILFLLIPGACLVSRAHDFPQFRGPLRDGHSPETGLLAEWPEAGPKLLWQVKNVGGGFSTPAVVGETIYLLGNDGVTNEFLAALSVRDGARLWSLRLGNSGQPNQNPHYPGSRSTPTVSGDLVYALGSDGDLVCAETASGKERWRKSLRADFAGQCGEWGYAESPLIDDDLLICSPGGASATMIALRKTSGETVWKCALPEGDDAGYASIVPADLGGVKQYVQFLAKGVVGVDAKTGKLLWRYERSAKGSPAVVITPVVSDGLIYTGAFMAGGALIKPVPEDGKWSVEEVYFNNKLPFGTGGVVKVGENLYGCGQSALCVDFKSGGLKWEERSPGLAWLVADNRIYVHEDKGGVALIEPSEEGLRRKGRFTPSDRPAAGADGNALAYPVVANGKLYIRELESLWCYDVRAAR